MEWRQPQRVWTRHDEAQVGKSQHLEGVTLDGEALAWDRGLCRGGGEHIGF